ncbi:MAG TPA: type II CAAX endopeptidase family protein [Terriglobia bacterium]|nr:type II CAAX endopeptidase family protein [Terriglobia bacterium]
MSLLPVFVNNQYEVRSGWKFAAYTAILVFTFVLTNIAAVALLYWIDPGVLLLPRSDWRFLGVNALVLLVPAVAALLISARIERVPVSAFGLSLHHGWLRDFALGIAVAGALLVATFGASLLFEGTRVEATASAAVAPAIGATFLILAISALNEELVFRGYPLQVFLKGIGPWGAILLISFIFGLLHARNPGATVLSTVNTILAGVFLCRAYLKTRSLWLPYGIHFGWNAGLAVVLGYPVSGLDMPSILNTTTGSEMILGGGYGPEGGILGTVLFLAAAIAIGWLPIGRVSPDMRATLTAHADKLYVEEL